MSWNCSRCGVDAPNIIQLSLNRFLCRTCNQFEKRYKAELINSLPECSEEKPPLGYRFVQREIFADELQGKIFADVIFDICKQGLSH